MSTRNAALTLLLLVFLSWSYTAEIGKNSITPHPVGALEQTTIYRDLKGYQNQKNKDYSKIVRSIFGRKEAPSAAGKAHLDKFLEQVRSFRNKDGSLSLKTTQQLLKADPAFTNLKGSSVEEIRRISHEIKAFDQNIKAEQRLLGKINALRLEAKLQPLKPTNPRSIKAISQPKVSDLKAEAITQKQTLVNKLLRSGKFASKAQIQAAVEMKDPAVTKLVQLQRQIDNYDRVIKSQPLNQLRYRGTKAAQSVKDSLMAMDIVQKGISVSNSLAGNSTMLEAYKTRRMEIFRELQEAGKYKTWREVREVINANRSQDPRILEIRSLDGKIQRIRHDIMKSKIPPIENSDRFSKRWRQTNGRIQELKHLKNHLQKQSVIDTKALQAVKLHQKRAYLQQAQLKLQHELLATKQYTSVQAIEQAVQTQGVKEPRINSLRKVQRSLEKLEPSITRSVSNRVGAVTKDFQKAKASQSSWSDKASSTVKNVASKSWQYTKDVAKNGAALVKAKHSSGLEYTRRQTAQGWDTVKVKTADGWEWVKARSQDANGWAKGKADAGWKFIGDKTRSLRAINAAKVQEFQNGSIEKARQIYNGSKNKAIASGQSVREAAQNAKSMVGQVAKNAGTTITNQTAKAGQALSSTAKAAQSKLQAGWEYTRGKTAGGIEFVKAKSVDGWRYTKIKGNQGWKVTSMKTADGWQWTKNQAQTAKGFVTGKAEAGWKYLGAKAEGVKALSQAKVADGQKWTIEKAQRVLEASKAGITKAQKTILGKTKASWEIVKTSGAKGIQTVQGKSADGWQYTKQKAADGWKMAKIRTADGWEWTKSRSADASGWAKGKADSGWKFVGNKVQTGKQALTNQAANLKTAIGSQLKAASGTVANGIESLRGKTIQAFEVSRGYAGQAVNSTVNAGKTAGKAFANRVTQGQILAGHEWVKPAAPGASKVPLQAQSPRAVPMPSQKAPLFSKAPNLANQSGAAARPLFSLGGSTTAAKISNMNNAGSRSNPSRGKGFLESEVVRNSLNPIKDAGNAIAKGIGDLKGKGIQEIYQKTVKVGNQVTDQVIGGKADAETGRTGYEVRRDAVADALTKKITQINQEIAKQKASGGSAKKIAKLNALKSSLETEYHKSQVGPQGLKFQAEISELSKQIEQLKKIGGDPKHIKSLEALKGQKTEALKKYKSDSGAVSRNYIRDGLQFAVISAATQGVMNIVDQVSSGEDVSIGDAFDFITTPQFVLGTSGAFAGGLLVQKGLTTGLGKIAMSAVQNMLPGFLKPVAMTLPYMMGAMVGSDLLTGTLGQRSVGQMVISGVGSSVGMMLGSAIFPPVGSLVGAVLGGMIADELMGGASTSDEIETEIKMLYEPHWLEFSELSWTEDDEDQIESAMVSEESDFVAYVTPILDGLQTIDELQAAKDQAYESYTEAVENEGPDSQKAQNAYKLYEEISKRMDAHSSQ